MSNVLEHVARKGWTMTNPPLFGCPHCGQVHFSDPKDHYPLGCIARLQEKLVKTENALLVAQGLLARAVRLVAGRLREEILAFLPCKGCGMETAKCICSTMVRGRNDDV